jgi:hypothetical protein
MSDGDRQHQNKDGATAAEIEEAAPDSPILARLLADPRTRRAVLRRIQARRERMAAGGRGTVEEGADMMVFEVDGETIAQARARQLERVSNALAAGHVALLRFDSILRMRAAKVDLGKGFGASATKTVKGWFAGQLEKAWPQLLKDAVGKEVGELVTATAKVGLKEVPIVGTALSTLSEGVEGHAKAAQANASVHAVDGIISAARQQIETIAATARQRLQDPSYARDLLGVDATDPGTPPVGEADIRDLIAHLDAQLKEAMFQSGTETTAEYLADLKSRKTLGAEMSAAEKSLPLDKR